MILRPDIKNWIRRRFAPYGKRHYSFHWVNVIVNHQCLNKENSLDKEHPHKLYLRAKLTNINPLIHSTSFVKARSYVPAMEFLYSN